MTNFRRSRVCAGLIVSVSSWQLTPRRFIVRFDEFRGRTQVNGPSLTEHYYDGEMPSVTLSLIESCPELKSELERWRPDGEEIYKSTLADDSVVDFVMLDGNVSHVITKLDRLRASERTFLLCK